MIKKHFVGEKIHSLTIIKELEERNKFGSKQWLCKCDCGNIKVYSTSALNVVKGCGCRKKEHGYSQTKLYKTYQRMKNRCYNKKFPHYEIYGGRGIKICNEWLNDFVKFKDWSLNNGYKEGLSIDRINPDGNYEPNNCRWTTMFEQASNKRNNVFYTINGIIMTQTQWCRFYNIPVTNVRGRLNSGWDIEKALTTPIKKWKR